MKSTALVTVVAIAAAVFSVAANAQTGRPSTVETKTAAISSHVVTDDELGSYARYLMLNGETREQAIADARDIDHAPTRSLITLRSRAQADATTQQ